MPGEGDFSTISVNSSRHAKTTPHAKDSNHPAIADHHQTTTSHIYFSYQSAEEDSHQQRQPARRRTVPATIATTSHTHYMRSMTSRKFSTSRWWITNAERFQRPNKTINIELPAFFMYALNVSDKKWVMIKGPTMKYYVDHICEHIGKKLGKGRQQGNIISLVRLPWASLQQPWRTDTFLPDGYQGLHRRVR